MNVWCMNLKDERYEQTNTKDKEVCCLQCGIIAIGWAVEDPQIHYQNQPRKWKAYQNAHRALYQMRPGDLVWVRFSDGAYRIARIESEAERGGGLCRTHDVGEGCHVTWFDALSPTEWPAPLAPRRLIARSTVRPVKKEDIRNATIDFFEQTLQDHPFRKRSNVK